MKEIFEDYLEKLKERRTQDGYLYTDDDFKKYIKYIKKCWKMELSVYKCLEFMYLQK